MNIHNIQYIKENYSQQISALNDFYSEACSAIPSEAIRFGGGTALAIYYLKHRLSFDIDLFVTDAQYLAYVSPKHWIDETNKFETSKYIDQANHIRVLTKDMIKVDILVGQDFIREPYFDNTKQIFNCDVHVESLEDIISKKIYYRKESNLTRDIFDIAVSLKYQPDLLANLYKNGNLIKDDLVILKDNLNKLNHKRYLEEIEIIEPVKKYLDISRIAPSIIIDEIKIILSH